MARGLEARLRILELLADAKGVDVASGVAAVRGALAAADRRFDAMEAKIRAAGLSGRVAGAIPVRSVAIATPRSRETQP